MSIKMMWVFIIILWGSFLYADVENVENSDKPLKGNWDFKLQKVWSINSAADTVIAQPGQMLVADDGTLYVQDTKHRQHYIFDSQGAFVKTFGKRGEGPGEIRRIDEEEMFLVGDKLIISDSGKIHYFDLNGEFIRSAVNTSMRRMPQLFLNENEFVYAPVFRKDMPGGKGKLGKYNLKTGKDSVVAEFALANPGKDEAMPEIVMGAITPLMILGYDNGKYYFGLNDTYRLTIAGSGGKIENRFTLDRAKVTIPSKAKKLFFNQWDDPQALVSKWIKTTPDEYTYFCHIEGHNGLIYVYRTYNILDGDREFQEIDIFSQSGKYLYKASIKPGDSLIRYAHRRSIVIKKGFLYLLTADAEGDIAIEKYRISLPNRSK
ncbi:MAG: 6-bladed beta-propeller [bacterium]|nr:6-bladed beta-propeller [bacterium]